MAWKEVSRTAIDIKKHPDQEYIGEYKGFEKIQTKIGEQTIYKFIDDDGNRFNIYGFTNLNRAMDLIAEGTLCRITTNTGVRGFLRKYGMDRITYSAYTA